MYRIITESGKILAENLTEKGAESWWNLNNGIYEDENGEERIYIEKM